MQYAKINDITLMIEIIMIFFVFLFLVFSDIVPSYESKFEYSVFSVIKQK